MSVERTLLPSGLTVVTERRAELQTAALGVFAGAGARFEAPDEHGIAHLLEHMAFKGTRRRDARRIVEEIENVGGDLNAATSAEQTAYYARVLGEDVGLGLDILADILTESVFDAGELEREKQVITQEINAVEDTPDDLVFDKFIEAAFPAQPLGRPILGTVDTVCSFAAPTLQSWLTRNYHAGQMVVAAVGAVEHDKVLADAERLFSSLSVGPGPQAEPGEYRGGEAITLRRDQEQANVLLGFGGLSYRHDDSYALGMFSNIVGGGMSSRLFQAVREERGLCYSIYAFHWGFSDTGIFGVSAGAGPNDLPTLVPVVLDELTAATEAITETELARAKAQMKTGQLMALESSSVRAEQLARHCLVWGRPLASAEIIERIDRVTIDDVRRVGRDVLSTPPTVAAIGPVKKMPKRDAVIRHMRG